MKAEDIKVTLSIKLPGQPVIDLTKEQAEGLFKLLEAMFGEKETKVIYEKEYLPSPYVYPDPWTNPWKYPWKITWGTNSGGTAGWTAVPEGASVLPGSIGS